MRLALTLLLLGSASCGRSDQPPPGSTGAWWTQSVAPDVIPVCGAPLPSAIPEVNGAGLALIDVDGDGVLEILLAQGATLEAPDAGPGCRLYRRAGAGWTDISTEADLEVAGWATSATPFDLEGDGDSDVVITRIGSDVLLRNDDGRFTDISAEADFDSPGWGTGAAAGDIDGDGWSDLYIVNYLAWDFDAPLPRDVPFMGESVLAGPRGLQPRQDRLFLNNRDGTFRDVTTQCGLQEIQPGFGLNAIIADIDGDGSQDVLVGNDTTPNMLLTRIPGDAFLLEDTALQRGLATNADGSAQATMGLALGDINGDGLADVFSTNFSSDTNTLHASAPGGWFADRTQAFGLGLPSRPYLGWTTVLLDGDLDGDEDLLILNGHVYPTATVRTMDSEWMQPVMLLERRGDRFERRLDSEEVWADTPKVHRTAVLGALDEEAPTLSLVTAPRQSVMEVVDAAADGPLRRLSLKLHDDRPDVGNREGHGASMRIDDGSRIHHRWMTTSSPFQGASAAQVHVTVPRGLGNVELLVNWPEGGRTRHTVRCARGVITVRRSQGTVDSS